MSRASRVIQAPLPRIQKTSIKYVDEEIKGIFPINVSTSTREADKYGQLMSTPGRRVSPVANTPGVTTGAPRRVYAML